MVDEDGPIQGHKSRNIKASTITVFDANENEIQKIGFIDDQGNIVG